MEKKAKKFDCVAMKHQGAEKIRSMTRGMTPEAEEAFWASHTRELESKKRKLQSREEAVAMARR